MSELEASGVEEHPPPYMIFVVVFLFFVTGLLGFLVCHLLKKKGYRCRTGDMDDEEEGEEEEEKLGGPADDEDEDNQDTVEQILKCIIENEANMEAFNEMFGNQVRPDQRLRKESIAVPPHHHTVHSGADHNSCHLCAQVRSKKGRRQSRTPRSKQKPGEQTVFSVGRFRVTHTDKKLHGGPNPMVGSGDQLDQSQDSEERKEGGYNLRSMFKDVRAPSEASNGVAPNVGKRRKSVTLFGLRRGSDPSGVKVRETGKETGGVKFAIQQQPVVLEELLQAENNKVAPERGLKPGIKPETEPANNKTPVSSEAKTLGSLNSSQIKDQAPSAAEDVPKHGPSPEPCATKPFIGTTASAPSSLPIPTHSSSEQTFKTTGKREVEKKVLRNEEVFDPGPLQTSTPINPMPGSIPGFTPGEPEACSSFPVTQTPPDPSSSPDLESGFGASLALMSLGSSPSLPIKTPSSSSSSKTPISPGAVTLSPKLSSRNTATEAAKSTISPALTPSPKLPSGRATSSQSPIPSASFGKGASPLKTPTSSLGLTASPKPDTMPVSLKHPSTPPADQNLSSGSSPRLTVKSGSVAPVTSTTKGDMVSSPQELAETSILKTEEKAEIMRVGILKTAKLSPVGGDAKGSALYSPTDQPSKDRLSSLTPSPSSPLSPSSPIGGRISSVTMVKASADSKRVFSVVTMVEQNESSPSAGEGKGATCEVRVESETSPGVGPGVQVSVSGVGQPDREETPGAEDRPRVGQEKEDMVEMEDIRDCKVTQVEEAENVEEESQKD